MSGSTTDFANPVPEARWDGPRRRRFRWAAAVIGTISLLAILRVAWTVFEVTHEVHTVSALIGLAERDAPAPATDGREPPNGSSDLPGGYASVTYSALPGQFEYWERANEYGVYGGSHWGLASGGDGSTNQVDLGHFLLAPMAHPAAEITHILRTGNPGAKITGPRRVTSDGHHGYTWKVVAKSGDVEYTTWFIGNIHSYRLECSYASGADDFARQCDEILRSVRIER